MIDFTLGSFEPLELADLEAALALRPLAPGRYVFLGGVWRTVEDANVKEGIL